MANNDHLVSVESDSLSRRLDSLSKIEGAVGAGTLVQQLCRIAHLQERLINDLRNAVQNSDTARAFRIASELTGLSPKAAPKVEE